MQQWIASVLPGSSCSCRSTGQTYSTRLIYSTEHRVLCHVHVSHVASDFKHVRRDPIGEEAGTATLATWWCRGIRGALNTGECGRGGRDSSRPGQGVNRAERSYEIIRRSGRIESCMRTRHGPGVGESEVCYPQVRRDVKTGGKKTRYPLPRFATTEAGSIQRGYGRTDHNGWSKNAPRHRSGGLQLPANESFGSR